MISTIQGLAYSLKDIIEHTPVQVMMIATPLAIVVLAMLSTATARILENFANKK